MLKIMLIIAAVLGVGIVAVLVLAARRPDTFTVHRSMLIRAPAEKIFPLINDFQNWALWSPYEKRDPGMKRGYEGPQSGKGAVYTWDGNNQVGSGRMELSESEPPSKVAIKLDMIKPFAAHNNVVFTLAPAAEGTNVTWTMMGPVPYFAKIIHMFMNMDKMVGGDFETGLANMKAAAEK